MLDACYYIKESNGVSENQSNRLYVNVQAGWQTNKYIKIKGDNLLPIICYANNCSNIVIWM